MESVIAKWVELEANVQGVTIVTDSRHLSAGATKSGIAVIDERERKNLVFTFICKAL